MPHSAMPKNHERRHASHLFTIRVWLEEQPSGEKEWHGKVQHVATGNARYFREWTTLVAYLEKMLAEDDQSVEN
jgi:hypothetical protein